ncbi:hypothetical protein Ocin01_17424 [Orchesella cincta]|uniref:WAP domain-containing protein n=1 Tax=Orchesella cincta TaxID=48709 RepID=A0A1D2M8K8_ORCCI|nr:hypothetical protein Ocin01_17424 [Orchesella cincta]
MHGLRKLVVFCMAVAVPLVLAYPADEQKPAAASFGNLKYTFGSKDEIPSAFFDTPPLKSSNNTRSEPETSEQRPVYPACQDGSGGMCVPAGTCPSQLKPETSEPGACESGKECCFGAPSNDKTCSSRGGECKPTKECGSAPVFLEAKDCDQKNGQVCCILI